MKRRTFEFIGDVDKGASIDIPKEAKERLNNLLREKDKFPNGTLDWEPFEVLRDIIADGKHRSIGGPPQVVKIYPHLNAQMFAVYWPSRRKGKLTIGGRDTLDYERTDWPRIDATTLEVSGLSFNDSTTLF